MRTLLALALLSASTLSTSTAWAAGAPPAPDEPGTPSPPPPPPPMYAPPPPGSVPAPPPGTEPPRLVVPPQGYSVPPPAQYQPTPPPSLGLHYEERQRTGMIVAGVIVFGAVYLNTAIWGYSLGDSTLAIPIVGPLWDLRSGSDSGKRFVNVLCLLDTAAQATGVALAIAGALTQERVLVRGPVTLLPTATPGGAGLTAIGRF